MGCGLCSSVLNHESFRMELGTDGFYYPIANQKLSTEDGKMVKKICPGIHIETHPNKSIWGNILSVCEAWATNPQIRYKAASGGVVTALAIHTLESGVANAILQVGVQTDNYLFNELKISKTREDIINNAQSRYAPALSLYKIKQLLDDSDDKYAFIGKPCDIAGIRNLCAMYPQYERRFVLLISIFCAGMPSYKASEDIWKLSGRTEAPVSLKYRGDGWPGNFCATWSDGKRLEMSYNDSWGKILGRQLGFRCKICPDGIGLLADVAIGDSWKTKNGYPDFTEADGRCFVFVRTDRGSASLQSAISSKVIESHNLNIESIKDMQAFQYDRRKIVGWRILPVQLFTGYILCFKGLGIWRQAISANIRTGLGNMIGTIKRMIRLKWGVVSK